MRCPGVGEVTWPGLTDVRGLDLDHAIQFATDAKGRARVSFYSSAAADGNGDDDDDGSDKHGNDENDKNGTDEEEEEEEDKEGGDWRRRTNRRSPSGGNSKKKKTKGKSTNSKKPPALGEGLNKPCVITLIGFRPESDRRARKMQRRIAAETERIGGDLVNYDCRTGAWTFALQKIC